MTTYTQRVTFAATLPPRPATPPWLMRAPVVRDRMMRRHRREVRAWEWSMRHPAWPSVQVYGYAVAGEEAGRL